MGELPTEVDKTGLWNITTILAYAKNITKNRADSHNGDEDSVASIIIVCIGLLMMMVMWVCTKDGVQLKCRHCDKKMTQNLFHQALQLNQCQEYQELQQFGQD